LVFVHGCVGCVGWFRHAEGEHHPPSGTTRTTRASPRSSSWTMRRPSSTRAG
jgi:hypothetical protein